MRTSKPEQKKRNDEIKELYLKGVPTKEIAKTVGTSIATVEHEITFIQEYYTKLAVNNPQIVKVQFERVAKLLEEVDLVKQEFWKIMADIKSTYEKDLKEYEEKVEIQKHQALTGVGHTLVPKKPKPPFILQLSTLKETMSRIEKEAKLLNLFNPKIDIHQTITINDFKTIMLAVRDIIAEFVPPDRQDQAMKRLMGLKVKDETIEAEIVEK